MYKVYNVTNSMKNHSQNNPDMDFGINVSKEKKGDVVYHDIKFVDREGNLQWYTSFNLVTDFQWWRVVYLWAITTANGYKHLPSYEKDIKAVYDTVGFKEKSVMKWIWSQVLEETLKYIKEEYPGVMVVITTPEESYERVHSLVEQIQLRTDNLIEADLWETEDCISTLKLKKAA